VGFIFIVNYININNNRLLIFYGGRGNMTA